MSESTPDAPASDGAAPPDTSRFSLVRVFCIVLPAFLLAVGCVLFFGLFDGRGWLSDMMKPPLVQGTGQVMFNGEPLSKGEVRTKPSKPGLAGAIGFMNEKGEFVLKTEIKGDFLDGAYPGEHRVMVTKYGMAQGPSAPLLVPQEYASFATTPLTIVISRDIENRFSLALEGEPASRGLSEEEFAAQQTETGPDALAVTSELFQQLDGDENGSLNSAEIEVLEGEALERVRSADRDGDGEIFHQELYGVVGRSPELFQRLLAENELEN